MEETKQEKDYSKNWRGEPVTDWEEFRSWLEEDHWAWCRKFGQIRSWTTGREQRGLFNFIGKWCDEHAAVVKEIEEKLPYYLLPPSEYRPKPSDADESYPDEKR